MLKQEIGKTIDHISLISQPWMDESYYKRSLIQVILDELGERFSLAYFDGDLVKFKPLSVTRHWK